MYGKSGSRCIVSVEANERDELSIRALFLFGNDNFVCDDCLSKNWESSRSHIDDYFGVDLTLFFAPLVTTFLKGGEPFEDTHLMDLQNDTHLDGFIIKLEILVHNFFRI